MHSKKIVTIGSAIVDVFITSPAFSLNSETGELRCQSAAGKLEVDSFDLRSGGGASNTAVGFARMGHEVGCIAELGTDEQARLVIADLVADGVNVVDLISEHKEQTGGSVILVAPSGERMVLVHRGAASLLDPADIRKQSLVQVDWVHLANLGTQFATVQHVFQLVVETGSGLSWNPGEAVLRQMVAEDWPTNAMPVTVLVVNQEEWAVAQPKHAELLAKIPQVIVTNGKHGGVVYLHGQTPLSYASVPAKTVDMTGAGDAFVVGYVSALLADKSIEVATQWGAKNAASVVTQIGAKPGLLYASTLA